MQRAHDNIAILTMIRVVRGVASQWTHRDTDPIRCTRLSRLVAFVSGRLGVVVGVQYKSDTRNYLPQAAFTLGKTVGECQTSSAI